MREVFGGLVIFISLGWPASGSEETPRYKNAKLPVEQRVDDLVSRMTLDEKVSQMVNAAPAIPRLDVPEYNWWNECLHGVGRAGLATVFPQAIGLAAAFDADFMYRVASAISDEARAKHHEFVRQGKRGIYQGLTFWSPNINIFRDPRWGRGMETYGEDPYLAGRLAINFIRGLQGTDPHYLKVVATAKHYAVHSGPEPGRHTFNAVVDERDLRETYLPQFESAVKDGLVYSVMCAYNRLMNQACCANPVLLNRILRNEWGFQGYVVSDCGAIDDIYLRHKIVETSAEAAAMSVKAGTDLECGNTFRSLKEAVAKGYITEKEIDTAVKRLFTARFKLGMFDPPEMVPFSKIPYRIVDSPEHAQLALQAAQKSIVLLKNENNLLPLKRTIRTIAVIGPNADDAEVLLGNYNGMPSHPVTPLAGIREKLGANTNVLYAMGCPWSENLPWLKAEPGRDYEQEALDAAKKAETVVMFMGLSPRLEGEEMNVEVEGFKGGDRLTLNLPAIQENLMRKIAALHKPTVLVLLNGSAVAVNWANENIPAILTAWYPGQAAGSAIADVLFGDVNPAGRLPVTFYRSVGDLPPFEDYSMAGRTYRYFKGEVLYPFGHGLSYTRFKYSKLVLTKQINPGQSVTVTAEVENTGEREGDEVVQLYLSQLDATVPVPIRSLLEFQRISLAPRGKKQLHFAITSKQMSVPDKNYNRVIEPGFYEVAIGGKQPGFEGSADASTTGVVTGRFVVRQR